MKTSYLIKIFFCSFLYFIFYAILFVCAGRLSYWQGLIYVLIGLIMYVLLKYTDLKIDSELSKERLKVGENTKNWDKIILEIILIVKISMCIVAGLDSGRYHWSPDFHWSIYLLGILLTVLGQLLFLIAQKQNRFFSSTVRIQTDRQHVVCETGLYKIVRHPAYMSSVIESLGFPLLFGSLWSFIPICILIVLLFVRTYIEDKTLKNELNGYLEYIEKTQYKIIPYVW
jgi:protein-S-isoprenylcysteine O-methyltransferase Ste14